MSDYLRHKVIAAPSTEAKQDTIIGYVDGVEAVLVNILAKIIASPATEAKQTALNALIGEVQANPTANTLLARLKALEDKLISGILLSGSNLTDADALPVEQTGKTGAFDTEVIPYTVQAFRGTTLYAKNLTATKLYKQVDEGVWTELWTISSGTISVIHATATCIIVFGSDGKVYRSADDETFTEVLTGIDPPLHTKGVASRGTTICFGEYTRTEGNPVRIYRSTDDGLTWTDVLNAGNSSSAGLRHFHTCQYIDSSRWIATTGDTTINWYVSITGETWILLFTSSSQYHRTLGVVAPAYNEIVWASDGSKGHEGVFSTGINSAHRVNYKDLTKLISLPTTSYAMAGQKNVLVATTRAFTSNYSGNLKSYIYVSIDSGNTWQIDQSYSLKDTVTYGGFHDIVGPDMYGKYYAQIDGVDDIADNSTIMLTPVFERERQIIREKPLPVIPRKQFVVENLTLENAPKGNSELLYYPPMGCIETLRGILAYIAAPTGAGSGTHGLQLTYGISGSVGRVFTANAAYNGVFLMTPLGWSGTFTEGTNTALLQAMDMGRIKWQHDTVLRILYQNGTDVARADTITVSLLIEREMVSY